MSAIFIMKSCNKKRQSMAWRTDTYTGKKLKARMQRKNVGLDEEEAGCGLPYG